MRLARAGPCARSNVIENERVMLAREHTVIADRNDARGIAQMMRVGIYRPMYVKTLRGQKLRMLLTHRKLLQSNAIAIENDLRGTFGLKVGLVGTVKVRGPHQRAGRELTRPGGSDRTVACCPAAASRAVCHPASPLAGARAG
jgi:transposase